MKVKHPALCYNCKSNYIHRLIRRYNNSQTEGNWLTIANTQSSTSQCWSRALHMANYIKDIAVMETQGPKKPFYSAVVVIKLCFAVTSFIKTLGRT